MRRGVYVPAVRKRALALRRLAASAPLLRKTAVKKIRRNVDYFTQVKNDFISAVFSVYSSPLVLISTLIAFVAVSTYFTTAALTVNSGSTYKLCTKLSSDAQCKKFVELAPTLVAPLCYIPAIIAAPKNLKFLLGLLITVWATVVPESSTYQYLIQSALLSLYLRVKRPPTRVFIALTAALCYKLGYLVK